MRTKCLITVLYGDNDLAGGRALWTSLVGLAQGIGADIWLVYRDCNAVLDENKMCGYFVDQIQVIEKLQQALLEKQSMLKQRAKMQLLKDGDACTKVAWGFVHFFEKLLGDREVKEAIFGISDDKALGPDGFTTAFYKQSWSVILEEVTRAIRLKTVLTKLIDSTQNPFVQGREISDNLLLAQELLVGYNQKQLPSRCVIKVDFTKAYESVEWNFCG
ncbi:hypothetical protein Sango_2475500 [Sesamum angolense]|uniref:Reverse transcriptase domain-containing protein n=1 Tax=Sesamum angolense TaxID=2727404 RepID=A0AAE1W3R0_9LAMI|nr:hypothetical protein Sango_2475500 [Sesamum angolense]